MIDTMAPLLFVLAAIVGLAASGTLFSLSPVVIAVQVGAVGLAVWIVPSTWTADVPRTLWCRSCCKVRLVGHTGRSAAAGTCDRVPSVPIVTSRSV